MATGSKTDARGRSAAFWGGVACFVAAALVMGVWVAQGAKFVTQYQVQETVVEEDEFGDEIERKEMVDRFRFGLLPDKGYDGAAPLAGGFGAVGLVLLWLHRRRVKRGDSTDEQSQ